MRSLNILREGDLRSRRLWRGAVAGCALACFTVSAFANDASPTLPHYLHEFWGPEKGFQAGSVSSIAQTTDGYLWIGTDQGLVRFDGFNFRRSAPDPFEIGGVRTVLADAQQNLWILLQNTRLFRYHGGIFELVRGQEPPRKHRFLTTDRLALVGPMAICPTAWRQGLRR